MKNRPPVDRELLLKSLQQRLEAGEISQEEYDKKVAELPADDDGR
jgi:uncharacterized membrane protein